MSGEVVLRRHYHYCERCQHGFYPLDIQLGLAEEGELSPKMAARVLDFGVTTVFAEAAERWAVHHSGSLISENLLRRVVERAGSGVEQCSAPSRQEALRPMSNQAPDVLVVQTDGSMLPMRARGEWKECKVGVVYDQRHHLRGGRRHRGAVTQARFVSSLRGIDDFRLELDAALEVERALDAKRVAWVGDGAPWNWSLREELCPTAVASLDFMHMAEHASTCGKAVLGDQDPWVEIWTRSIVQRINAGLVHDVLADLRDIRPGLRGERRQAVDDLIRYYETNADRMNYPHFRALGLPIGSGAAESAHRHVLQARMKLAGQHWAHPHAHRMALLRCAYRTVGPARFAETVLPMAA